MLITHCNWQYNGQYNASQYQTAYRHGYTTEETSHNGLCIGTSHITSENTLSGLWRGGEEGKGRGEEMGGEEGRGRRGGEVMMIT